MIQMHIGNDGKGTGTMSYAARITPLGDDVIQLEKFASSPVMLTEIEARKSTTDDPLSLATNLRPALGLPSRNPLRS